MTDAYTLAPLLYHFAGADAIPAEWQPRFADAATAWGRHAGLLRGDGYVQRRGELGPSNEIGLFAAPGVMECFGPDSLRLDRDRQDWAEFAPGVWCGVSKAAGPADFMRARICTPVAYVLKTDRGDWFVPVAMLSAVHCNLPRVDQYRAGAWTRVAAADFAQLSVDAETLYKAEIGEAPLPGLEALRDIAIRALSANYALTGPELGLLGLLNDDAYVAIAGILTDRAERQKKTTASAG